MNLKQNNMKEDFFTAIMQKYGIDDKTVIQNAFQDIVDHIAEEQEIAKGCRINLEKMIVALSQDILNFQYVVSAPIFIYKNCLVSKCRENPEIYLWQFVENIHLYASILESQLKGLFRIKIVDNDIKISLIREIKKKASIAADAINKSIFSDVNYDADSGRFTITANIIDCGFFERQGISYYPRETDARKAVFSGVMKDKKVKFDLSIGREVILTDFEIVMVQECEETGVSQILRDSVIKANSIFNGRR